VAKALFVCYQHGCKGEFLSHKISTHKFFRTLSKQSVNNRPIITNDFFGKQLLNSWFPEITSLNLPTDHNIVVPSHYFYDTLKNYFPNAYFVSIEAPKDIDSYRQDLFDRFYSYKTTNMLELAGECENRYREYHSNARVEDIMEFTSQVFRIKNVTFGDIRCMAKGVLPTDENKKMLLKDNTPDPLSKENKQNSFVVAYENVANLNVQDIIDYVNK